ncbi:hypothetical protein pqer_cds_1144 [Pandoravirus quercus]|uniref:Uncharacterized protein n=2 Tax=Pandoravirus TaxID=2060084 RepID=A0A2U7UAW3_9VIRU|nr:hypothetical protein pqer_cds_1144 [Pandoravirus quercus]AVK75566.1 hypothetical protein pqer_cds_1144 [Pandoravirus quercus]QBZ81741.1 hypothetical protein pclt_cds_1159 [Pandoravirus celtis]
MESTPPPRHAAVAGFLGPALLVVELQGVACANPTAVVGDSLANIVDTASRSLAGAGDGGVHLLAAYAMDRRPCDSKSTAGFDDHAGNVPMRPDDICTVLCVGALRSASTSHWVALDMNRTQESVGPNGMRARRGRKWFAIGAAQATLLGCFTRHASINSHGAIDRKMEAADGCETCARTWRGFRLLFSRPRPRQRVNAARLAAVTAASLDARRCFRNEAGLVDVLCAGAVALREVAPRMAPTDPCLVRAERALATLGAQIEAALAVCLWADRFGASAALAIMADADSRAATTLPEHPPRLRQPADVLESVVAVAVAAGLLVARANLAAAGALVATTGSDKGDDAATPPVSVVPSTLTSSWISSVLSDRGEADMGDWASRASAIFVRVRQAAAAHAARAKVATVPQPAAVNADAGSNVGSTQTQQQQHSPSSVSVYIEASSDVGRPVAATMRCARADCRAPGRRIASGCVISAHCTCGCRATFHRACWEDVGIVLVAGVPCPTPDCWGEITRVTSARSKATDRPPRVLWQSPLTASSTPASAMRTSASCRSLCNPSITHDAHLVGGDDDIKRHDQGYVRRRGDNDNTTNHDQPAIEADGTPKENPRDGDGQRSHGDEVVPAVPTTGGTPYHKHDPSREMPPIRRKRPRDRSGKRQRRRLAKQQNDRLLVLAGLVDPPLDHPKAGVTGQPGSAHMDDDTLWPPFFVPDPV